VISYRKDIIFNCKKQYDFIKIKKRMPEHKGTKTKQTTLNNIYFIVLMQITLHLQSERKRLNSMFVKITIGPLGINGST